MNFLDAIILGVIEGLTEFLPVSSTGHLILSASMLNLESNEFLKSFEIIIQLGAISAVLILYWRSFLNLAILRRLAVACLPVFTIGFILYKLVKQYFLANNMLVIAGLFLGGIFLMMFEWFRHKRASQVTLLQNISYRQAFLIGLCQIAAIVPGVSRSGASMVGGMACGLDRQKAAEFSFLLAVPTILAAALLDILKSSHNFTSNEWQLLAVGCVVSLLVAIAAIKFLLLFVKRLSLAWFGLYRMAAAFVAWIFV